MKKLPFCLFILLLPGCRTTAPEVAHTTVTAGSDVSEIRVELEETPKEEPSIAPVPEAPKSPFVVTGDAYPVEIVLASIQSEPHSGGTVLGFDSPHGMQAWFYDASGTRRPIANADKAQLACMDGSGDDVRIGVVERNANGGFLLAIRGYSSANPNKIRDNWHVSMRGFEPVAGSRCLIRGKRELFITGTRPHKDKVPYRGLFHIQPHSFRQVLPDSAQIPEIIARRGDRFVTRQIVREPEKSPEWKQYLYRDEGDGNLRLERTADFLVPSDEGWLSFTRSGCLVENDATYCPETPVAVTSMYALPGLCSDGLCMEWLSAKQAWIVHSIPGESPQIREIPRERLLLPIRNGDGAWLSVRLDPVLPDRGTGLEFVVPEYALP